MAHSPANGHVALLDSPWALTSVSQQQFWEADLAARTDGAVEGVLSVIVSDWNTPGVVHDRPARECTPAEIREEVWAQLARHRRTGPQSSCPLRSSYRRPVSCRRLRSYPPPSSPVSSSGRRHRRTTRPATSSSRRGPAGRGPRGRLGARPRHRAARGRRRRHERRTAVRQRGRVAPAPSAGRRRART